MGNLVPLLGALPFGVVGLALAIQRQQMSGLPLWVFSLMPVAGWLLMNSLGLFENAKMRAELQRRLSPRPQHVFVGVARPSFRGLLDPHEDVGFLVLGETALEFLGESLKIRIDRKSLNGVRFRPNVHSMVGLGRWVSVEGVLEGTPIRLLIEPRERRTLWGNRAFSKELKQRIEEWVKGERQTPPPDHLTT